jgi:pyrophosphatase PpaX
MRSKINTVLFDFDGTIMDTTECIVESWKHVFSVIKGEDVHRDKIIATLGEPIHLTVSRDFPDVPLERVEDVYREYHYRKYKEMISPYPGVPELLKKLHEEGYDLGIVTSRYLRSTKIGLDLFDMTGYFGASVTCEHTEAHKPDPEPLRLALKTLGRNPEEAVMVGDAVTDILCAKNAGAKSAMVGWSPSATVEFLSGPDKPDYVINVVSDLPDLLLMSD